MAGDSELWNVIFDGPFVPVKTIGEPAVTGPKTRKGYNDVDRKAIEKNFQSKRILVCGIGPDKYTESLPVNLPRRSTHKGTTQFKHSKIDMLTTEYELFRMKDDESIQDMHTRFTFIINKLHSLGEIISRNKLVRKILSVLPGSWENKVVKKNPVRDKRFKRKDVADNVVKQALTAWGDSSSKSGEDDEQGETSMMAVESEAAEYDSIFALMAKSDDDEDDDNDDEHERDDLLVVVVVQKEKIEELKRGNSFGNIQKGKEVARGAHIKLENELKFVKSRSSERKQSKWYMDSGCSERMTGNIDDFLSLKALQGGSVSFGNGKKGYILGVGRIGKTLTH
ncbi:uncharacterized protein [Nicotiana tomentosiformis]|uniref:uncharacterized protein n=1 Tax=Nicotiana tomentosiformis TaxID=4098 RepID=UPI00388CA457